MEKTGLFRIGKLKTDVVLTFLGSGISNSCYCTSMSPGVFISQIGMVNSSIVVTRKEHNLSEVTAKY